MQTTSGTTYPASTLPGVAGSLMASLTMGAYGADTSMTGQPADIAYFSQTTQVPATNYLAWIGGLFLLLVAIKLIQDHDKSGLEPRLTGVNVHNLIVVTFLALFGLIVTKLIVNKYLSGVKPLADLVNMA